VVNISAIGAGGGSILRVDAQGVLKVGPTSAGADPGPACYGKGGSSATITDCYLVCGFLDADGFLGGRLTLSKERANSALGQIARGLGYLTTDGEARAAEAAIKVASSMMATEVRKLLARRGSDVREFTLLPYGGAGATHAAFLADEAGIERILIPKTPGTFCALGAVVAKLKRDFVRSCTIRIAASECADQLLATELADLTREATAWASGIGDRVEKWQLNLSADIRYPGQAFELTIDHEDLREQADVGQILRGLFQHRHHKLYGFSDPESPVELVRLVVSAVGALSGVAVSSDVGASNSGERYKPAFLAGNWTEVRCLKRESIMPGEAIDGPAIVEQSDTTVVIPRNWRMTCLDSGDLLLTARGRAE
jgi:N-methylhydantoinase A